MQGFGMGRYVPPDLEGTTSFNVASGKGHALGARARKLKSEGILVVRFECPFAIWCTNCQPEQIIGQGVRFNAEKKKVGNYYSTPIWSFKFKHTVCGKSIEVHTDPKNAEYMVVEGGRRRDTGADKVLDGEVRIGATEEEKERLEKDGGFGVLEQKLEDKREADTQKRRLDQLAERSERDWSDPYEMSKRLRRGFRVGRRQRQADAKSGEALQDKFGLGLQMVAPVKEDAERATYIDFGHHDTVQSSHKPLFANSISATTTTPTADQVKRQSKNHDKLTARKDAFQNLVKGNTRSALDPFLSNEQFSRARLSQPRVKRQRVEHIKEVVEASSVEVRSNAPDGVIATSLVNYESDSS